MSEFDLADFLRSQAAQFAPETESYKDRVRAAAEIERLRAELAENEGVIAVWRRRAAEAEAECARLRQDVANRTSDRVLDLMAERYALREALAAESQRARLPAKLVERIKEMFFKLSYREPKGLAAKLLLRDILYAIKDQQP